MDWATIYARLRSDPNDQAAWDTLEGRVRAWAYHRLQGIRVELVEDAIADSCATVVMDLGAARGPDTFRGFVLGKCLNAAKGATRQATLERVSIDAAGHLPAVHLADADDPRFGVLDRCLERLPERDRRAVELRYFGEARADQIARELQVSEVVNIRAQTPDIVVVPAAITRPSAIMPAPGSSAHPHALPPRRPFRA